MADGHGGRRSGAGRPPGTAWRPTVTALRLETIEKMREIVAADRDPLSTVVDWVLDESLDIQLRLSAAHVCLPYLYPRLNATTVDSRITVTKVDSAQLLDRLSARIERLAASPVIEVAAPAEAPEPAAA